MRGDARVPVCVFAKPPVAGETKTRLARGSIGADGAARLARAFFEDTWATVSALPWARPVLATTASDLSAFAPTSNVEVWMQGTGDLGERMERILARAVAEAGRGMVLGADLPGLPRSHLDTAREVLARHEAVLGPSEDGGFYLLGLSRVPEGILTDLPWSSPDTMAQTERRLAGAGLTTARAPRWFDVDVPADLLRLRRLLADDPRAAPRTRAVLTSMAPGWP